MEYDLCKGHSNSSSNFILLYALAVPMKAVGRRGLFFSHSNEKPARATASYWDKIICASANLQLGATAL